MRTQEEADAYYRSLAQGIDDVLNGTDRPKRIAFCILIAGFGMIDNGRVSYVSNANRDDMIAMVKEWLARTEGRIQETETKQ